MSYVQQIKNVCMYILLSYLFFQVLESLFFIIQGGRQLAFLCRQLRIIANERPVRTQYQVPKQTYHGVILLSQRSQSTALIFIISIVAIVCERDALKCLRDTSYHLEQHEHDVITEFIIFHTLINYSGGAIEIVNNSIIASL